MTHPRSEPAAGVIRAAELIVINAKWHWHEQQAPRTLATAPGLACAPLFPGRPVIQVVAFHGELLGRVRRHTTTTACPGSRYRQARDTGSAHTAPRAAARALARSAGRPHLRVTVL
ncbi:hypothetical protein [Streptomyces sp. TS71-3]|uniref:hypothetical protein n=1 Tax=Streptomyces sp. TS71-3 TaxID=2733862 RepID=UPI001B0E6C96|nr:hypothetical protein [Streptomyces sp. TS71-3]GHJ41179.1 hypothetical protein Sm713_67880 [Streptomyces sp. TS71-3]